MRGVRGDGEEGSRMVRRRGWKDHSGLQVGDSEAACVGNGEGAVEALGKNHLPRFPYLHSVPARGGENACPAHPAASASTEEENSDLIGREKGKF